MKSLWICLWVVAILNNISDRASGFWLGSRTFRSGPRITKERLASRVDFPPLPSEEDATLNRNGTWSRKWTRFGGEGVGPEHVVPLWVADMDFRCPKEVTDALQGVLDQGVFGYTDCPPALADAMVARLHERHGFGKVLDTSMLRWLPGLLPGLNHVIRARRAMDRGVYGALEPLSVAVTTPIYAPFLAAPSNCDAELVRVPLARKPLSESNSRVWRYELDEPALAAALAAPDVKVLLWCSPHNPTGRVWSRQELKVVASLCVEHDVTLLSDEVWADLVLTDEYPEEEDQEREDKGEWKVADTTSMSFKSEFVGMASLCEEMPGLAERLAVITSPSKTFNVASLDIAVAAIPGDKLRRAFRRVGKDAAEVTPFGYAAALAVYGPETQACVERWRQRLVRYLRANRDVAEVALLNADPNLRLTRPEASYLTWVDCADCFADHSNDNANDNGSPGATSCLPKTPFKRFLEGGVAFTDGGPFGDPSAVRLNFATRRDILDVGLDRAVGTFQGVRSPNAALAMDEKTVPSREP